MVARPGRPSRYRARYAEQAYQLCLLGYTDAEVAAFFGIAEKTFYNWQKNHPKFLQATIDGKQVADAAVARALYERALGYEHDEDKIFQYEGRPVVVPTIKHYPPDTQAASLWLRNRQPDKWRDKREIEHSGEPVVRIRDYSGVNHGDATQETTEDGPGDPSNPR